MLRKEKLARKNVIEDKAKRTNLKSKRKRTLFRKAIEVSQMCQLDIFIAIHDRETRKVYQYNSGGVDTDPFSIEKVQDTILTNSDDPTFSMHIYTDRDYEKL